MADLFTEILSEDDDEAGIHMGDFVTAVMVWSFMQNRFEQVSVEEASRAFNTTPELIREAVKEHGWMYLIGSKETDPAKQFLGHDGE